MPLCPLCPSDPSAPLPPPASANAQCPMGRYGAQWAGMAPNANAPFPIPHSPFPFFFYISLLDLKGG
ncbi:MAG: hypothetical protein F6J93_08425 [Oscillatoria sp. SIO1A7]|nr:hypothetical protein [Oscillatoria sp. SIO1A7]